MVVATGAYNLIWTRQDLRRTLEKRLRQLRTDYIDVFHFLGVMKPEEFPEPLSEELQRLKEDGRVRAVACPATTASSPASWRRRAPWMSS